MTNWQYFKERCQEAEVFSYHVYYKNDVFESKRNDIEALRLVDEGQILYFEGFYECKSELDFEYSILEFLNTFTRRLPVVGFACRSSDTNFKIFGLDLIIALRKFNVTPDKVDSMISILYEEFEREEKASGKYDYRMFRNNWSRYLEEAKTRKVNKVVSK